MSYDPGPPGDRPQQPGSQGWSGAQPYPGPYGQQLPPPPPGWGQPAPSGPGGAPAPDRGSFMALFDFSFTNFVTPGLVRLMYMVGTGLIVLAYLGYVIVFFNLSAAAGLITVIIGAVVALFSLALLRVSLEFYYAVVRMSEDIHNRR